MQERVHKLAEEVGRVVGGLRLSVEKAKKSPEDSSSPSDEDMKLPVQSKV